MGGKGPGNASARSDTSKASDSSLTIEVRMFSPRCSKVRTERQRVEHMWMQDCGAWHMIYQRLDVEDIIKAKRAFRLFDKDDSGSISVSE